MYVSNLLSDIRTENNINTSNEHVCFIMKITNESNKDTNCTSNINNASNQFQKLKMINLISSLQEHPIPISGLLWIHLTNLLCLHLLGTISLCI
jgi:hypothetical protein